MLSAEELAFVKGNGFQVHPEAVPVSTEAAPTAVEVEAPRAPRLPLPTKPEREGTVRFTVDMRVSQHKALKRAALDLELPMTDLIRHIVADWLLERQEGQQG
jgi:hypothetical protein